jgi:hypothetical protein
VGGHAPQAQPVYVKRPAYRKKAGLFHFLAASAMFAIFLIKIYTYNED